LPQKHILLNNFMKLESYWELGTCTLFYCVFLRLARSHMSDLIQGYQTRQLKRSSQILLLKILNLV